MSTDGTGQDATDHDDPGPQDTAAAEHSAGDAAEAFRAPADAAHADFDPDPAPANAAPADPAPVAAHADAVPADATSADAVPADPPVGTPWIAPPSLLPLPPGTAAGWYRTTSDSGALRWWDGAAWTAQLAPAESPAATFGQKFRRRFPIAVAVVAVLNIIAGLTRLVGDNPFATLTPAVRTGLGIGLAVGLLVSGAFWGAIASLFPGRAPDPNAPRKPLLRRPWTWAIAAAVVAVPVAFLSVVRTPSVPTVSIASTKEGCHAFLTTVDTMAAKKLSNAGSVPYLQALPTGAVANDPDLAADLAPTISAPTNANLQTATTSILKRCIANGDLTPDEVTAWAKGLQNQ